MNVHANAAGDDADERFAALWPQWCELRDAPELTAQLEALAAAGHAPSAFALARLAFDGSGAAPRDTAAAFAWAQQAAQAGFAAAAAMVGDFYLHAEPEHGACTRDAERALHWHERAALAGHDQAALAASDAHRMGRGTPRDFGRGWFFLRIALHAYETPPPLTEILVPSLLTDLGEDKRPVVDAQVEPLLAQLPHEDATLDGYWRSRHDALVGARPAPQDGSAP